MILVAIGFVGGAVVTAAVVFMRKLAGFVQGAIDTLFD